MTEAQHPEQSNTCSFCGLDIQHTRVMVNGVNGSICENCVKQAAEVVRMSTQKTFDVLKKKMPKPRDIFNTLSQYVIGQDEAKRRVSVAVYNHYKRIVNLTDMAEVELDKSNILMIGPTGTGKTLMAQTLARFLDVPFAIADATTLTEAGYVGDDVENVLVRLVQAAQGNIALAEIGIVFIDEIDKIARKDTSTSITRDVSGEGVQQALLKILEGTVSHIPPAGGRKHPDQKLIPVNTKNILFICGGAFEGIDQIIQQRVGQQGMGFEADVRGKRRMGYYDLVSKVQPEDLLKYGLIPELIGRLAVVTPLDRLSAEAMRNILVQPRNALVRQYEKLLMLEGIKLTFTDPALDKIVQLAMKHDTGARSLRSITEGVMNQLMYELPDMENIAEVIITPDVITGKEKPLLVERLELRSMTG